MSKYRLPILIIIVSVLTTVTWRFFPVVRSCLPQDMKARIADVFDQIARSFADRFSANSADDDKMCGVTATIPPDEPTNVKSAEVTLKPDDPPPNSLTSEQRKAKYRELMAAAKARRIEVMRSSLSQSKEGLAALDATIALNEKVKELDKMVKLHGATDIRVERVQLEIVRLKDEARRANEAYKTWKLSHPGKVPQPDEDPVYRDLVARSRFYVD